MPNKFASLKNESQPSSALRFYIIGPNVVSQYNNKQDEAYERGQEQSETNIQ